MTELLGWAALAFFIAMAVTLAGFLALSLYYALILDPRNKKWRAEQRRQRLIISELEQQFEKAA